MKLIDLNPRWLSYGGEGVTCNGQPVPERSRIGIAFSCPCGCDRDVAILFANPVDGGPSVQSDGQHAWQRVGDDFETLSLTPSILRMDGCKWHGFITNGEAITC